MEGADHRPVGALGTVGLAAAAKTPSGAPFVTLLRPVALLGPLFYNII